jgi:hypothetical protein
MSDTFEVLQEKLIKMSQYITELKQLSAYTYEEYADDMKIKYSVERLLQLIIDLALDINNMILSYLKSHLLQITLTHLLTWLKQVCSHRNSPQKLLPPPALGTGWCTKLIHMCKLYPIVCLFDKQSPPYTSPLVMR